jgi:hypothetical protein
MVVCCIRVVQWLLVSLFHSVQTHEGDMRLVSVYVPTNHVYVGECAVVPGGGVLICCTLFMTAQHQICPSIAVASSLWSFAGQTGVHGVVHGQICRVFPGQPA